MMNWLKKYSTLKFSTLFKNKFICFLLMFVLGVSLSGATKSTTTPSIRVPIFGFHNIIDFETAEKTKIKPLTFEHDYSKREIYTLLNYLVDNNYWFLSSQDLFTYFIQKSKPIPSEYLNRKPVMITFDDGYLGVHENLLPILKDLEKNYGETVKVVLFINPGSMGVNLKDFVPHISCDQLREGYRRGFYDIQSHGFSHQNLSKLDLKNLELELEKSKTKLRECVADLDRNKWVGAHIAYPYGSVSPKVEKYLPKYHLTGYLYDGIISRPNRLRNPFQISRVPVNRYITPQQLIQIANRATPIKQLDLKNP
ncbi:MAG: polysaccharide deacetylase family protein [Limnoraphis robusta]|uniref:Polysaccharide deacetylase family protein n=1 Tax=Limnoraphis robusta CCNP1315 TaxID=3110306 RepID=A0ABU5U2S7_9CYAN|nr:polysaccharide deacetylase family protein [Limnoraphis robusta]MEA5521491.1 polysaccharide deacetylase family protein [Limnoraphis robusta CCNP1315]MEA5546426.1 polysaccharide deacetylase family protein [Limnoraphis robusta CCNP1324]